MDMITSGQITKIHALKNAIGLDDAAYKDMLDERFGVTSSKKLTAKQAAFIIGDWEKKATDAGSWKPHPGRKRFQEFKGRSQHLATPRQMRMVRAMWDQVARAPKDQRDTALDKLLRRVVKRDSINFLRKTDVAAVVEALEAMGAKKEAA